MTFTSPYDISYKYVTVLDITTYENIAPIINFPARTFLRIRSQTKHTRELVRKIKLLGDLE